MDLLSFTTNVGFARKGKQATGNITVTNFNNTVGDTITVGTKVLTEEVDWTAATSNAVTASSIASAINANPSTCKAKAVAVGGVVNITAIKPGTSGNSIALGISDGAGLSKSGTTLKGGRN